jgi:hypothetical protein
MLRTSVRSSLVALSILGATAFLASEASEARADDELTLQWTGRIQTDLRFRVEDKAIGAFYDKLDLAPGVERNQNVFNLQLKSTFGRFRGVASVDLLLNGVTGKLNGLGDLSTYQKVQPFSFEPQALYIEAKDLIVKGLDLRIGHQVVSWGVADQFNPTNNLNADDLRDPLLFGRQQANFMVKADYWVSKSFSVSGVLVPIFKPALLPYSAALGVGAVDRLPFTDAAFRHRIEAENATSAGAQIGFPTIVSTATPVIPDPLPENMQGAVRIAGTIADQDVSLSYYNGRTDFPQPFLNHTKQTQGLRCDPDDKTKCVKGVLETDVSLMYPRMHVYGLNATGEVNPFKWISDKIHGIGYRVEAALVVPERTTLKLINDALNVAIPLPAGEYDYDNNGKPGGKEPAVVDATPFLKWTVGLDYAFGDHVYLNVQWVHGLADEFGAGDFLHKGYSVRQSGVSTSDADTRARCVLSPQLTLIGDGTKCAREVLAPKLGDYAVIGADLKFFDDAMLLRLFTLWSMSGVTVDEWSETQQKRTQTHHGLFSKEGFSAVIFPELEYNFGNGLELGAGALIELGKDYTKFGDPAAGGSTVFTRGKFSF